MKNLKPIDPRRVEAFQRRLIEAFDVADATPEDKQMFCEMYAACEELKGGGITFQTTQDNR